MENSQNTDKNPIFWQKKQFWLEFMLFKKMKFTDFFGFQFGDFGIFPRDFGAFAGKFGCFARILRDL